MCCRCLLPTTEVVWREPLCLFARVEERWLKAGRAEGQGCEHQKGGWERA